MTLQAESSAESQGNNSDANVVLITGRLLQGPDSDKTGAGTVCATALLRSQSQGKQTTVRVNAYGRTAEYLESFTEGSRVMVRGELISRSIRSGSRSVIELKAHFVELLTA